MVALKYKGGRTLVKEYFNRVAYVFKKENDYVCEVPEEVAKKLLIIGSYEVMGLPEKLSAPAIKNIVEPKEVIEKHTKPAKKFKKGGKK